MREAQLARRLLLYVFGLFIVSIGVALALGSGLGVSPVDSFNYVLSLVTGLSVGTCVFFMFLLYTLLQIPILGKQFKWIQLTQVAVAFLFGYFIDFALFLVGDLRLPTYFGQALQFGIGIFTVSSGLALYMRTNLINLPPDALVAAIATRIPNGTFHRVKIVFDCLMALLTALLSLLFLHGLYGVREGTVFAAIFLGKWIPLARRLWVAPLEKCGIINWEE